MGESPEDLWSHPQLVAAVTSEDWGAVFRTYRKLTGLSQMKLGERVGLVQPDVSDIERGRRRVTSVDVRQRSVSARCRTSTAVTRPGIAFAWRTRSLVRVSRHKPCRWLWRAFPMPPPWGVRTHGMSCIPLPPYSCDEARKKVASWSRHSVSTTDVLGLPRCGRGRCFVRHRRAAHMGASP